MLVPRLLWNSTSFSSSSAFRLRCPLVLATDNPAAAVFSLVVADNEVFIASRFAFVKVVTGGCCDIGRLGSCLA